MSDAIQQLPPPSGEGDEVWPRVMILFTSLSINEDIKEEILRDMVSRSYFGEKKYSVPLRTFDGRSSLVDAYQEALDLTVYLYKNYLETGKNKRMHNAALSLAIDIKLELMNGKV